MKKILRWFALSLVFVWTLYAYAVGVAVLAAAAWGYWQVDQIYQIWPDWQTISEGPIPKSHFIDMAEADTAATEPLRWTPVTLDHISPHMQKAVVMAEDIRFWKHHGLDLAAIGEAVDKNINDDVLKMSVDDLSRETLHKLMTFKVGASTISQQMVKNLFLTSEKSLRRKAIEILWTVDMERHLSKERIMEIYLNIAQFGDRLYGVEAASRYYFKKSAGSLGEVEAASLAVSLPDPTDQNPKHHGRAWERRRNNVLWFMAGDYSPPKDRLPPQLGGAVTAPSQMTAPAEAAVTAPAEITMPVPLDSDAAE